MSATNIEKQEFDRFKLALSSLSVFRNLLNDKVIKNFRKLLDYTSCADLNEAVNCYMDFYFSLIESDSSTSFKEYILDKILFDENRFSFAASTLEFSLINSDIKKAVLCDLNNLQFTAGSSSGLIKSHLIKSLSLTGFEENIINHLPDWNTPNHNNQDLENISVKAAAIKALILSSKNWDGCLEAISDFYFQNGEGIFAKYYAFIWERSGGFSILRGIENPDPVRLSDLFEYNLERAEVINNTVKFLNNLPANNVLLYGDRGTGKSSTVKAILNEYHNDGLRVIEVPKNSLIDFPEIIKNLKNKRQKYIIFVDDLAFDDNEENYTALKAVLEGGLESKPENVIIYATSNRRHLIKEKFSDRSGLLSGNIDDEVRASDSIQEKLSLADRFGITVVFSSPDKKRYLEIVEGIAKSRGLNIDREYLHREAMKWELWYNGRSPRTAKQFVDYLEGEKTQTPRTDF